MPTTGYVKNPANSSWSMDPAPSNKTSDYTQASNGLWYYKPPGSPGSSGPTERGAEAAAAGAQARQYIASGEAAVTGATSAAASNLSAVQNMANQSAAQSNADLNTARSANATLVSTADSLGKSASDVNTTATDVGKTASIFEQYAASMEQDAVFARANALPWLEQSEALLNMDSTAGGIAGEWNKIYNQMSPDALAASAATSAKKAAATNEASMLRTLARRGISAGSGAVAAALGKAKEQESATVAAVMTSARKAGLSLQSEALRNGLTLALQASGMSQKFADMALEATTAASTAQAHATSALATKGSLQTQAANILSKQGDMYAVSGNLALGISSAITQNMSARASALTGATNAQVNAQTMAADYYSTQGGSLTSMLTQQHYNVLTSLFGTMT